MHAAYLGRNQSLMPDLVKLLIRHALIGFGLATLLVSCLILFNVGNLRNLIAADGPVALLMLTLFMGLTFASAQMGIGVMLAGRDRDDDDYPGTLVAAVGSRLWAYVHAGR